jgi:hypothetical protein
METERIALSQRERDRLRVLHDHLAAANHFLEMRFLPACEQRFTVALRSPRNAHRRLDDGSGWKKF